MSWSWLMTVLSRNSGPTGATLSSMRCSSASAAALNMLGYARRNMAHSSTGHLVQSFWSYGDLFDQPGAANAWARGSSEGRTRRRQRDLPVRREDAQVIDIDL